MGIAPCHTYGISSAFGPAEVSSAGSHPSLKFTPRSRNISGCWCSGQGLLSALPAAAQSLVFQLEHFHLCFWTPFAQISLQRVSFQNKPQATNQLKPTFYVASDAELEKITCSTLSKNLTLILTDCNFSNRQLFLKSLLHFRVDLFFLIRSSFNLKTINTRRLALTSQLTWHNMHTFQYVSIGYMLFNVGS